METYTRAEKGNTQNNGGMCDDENQPVLKDRLKETMEKYMGQR